ncbi:dicarboxylate/amino acid:cation symporter [Salisediminibacterium selenitireducens]|uniref:Sodium:dicarboxylate symporter n=1 Tax=Bacillus selenitireducens (strain ATCC 700615 / DSM 15326 / MLS10) TaxID=439292 RepID=D6XU74_BACIE|nr:dicarboxylate/amino acid:cation symporter [Salisediminibacterium selenitireducens]ADH99360.1 sodium:dicarboxylate symporter [[Bacillus] selenitireducens MLS10]
MKLILKLIIGIAGGIIIGLIGFEPLTKLLITFEVIFGQFIGFMIPLIILFFIASGVANLGGASGRLVGLNVGTAYLSTLLAGIMAYFVAVAIMPMIASERSAPEEDAGLEPFLELEIEPLMGVITALVLAFVFGIAMSKLKTETLISVFDQGKAVVELVIKGIIIPLLPFFIAGIFAGIAAEGTVFETLQIFGLVLVTAIVLHWVWISIQYTLVGLYTGRNPLQLIKTMLPAYFTALGTMSSAATIPVTLKQAKENKVREEVANFSVPLGATIHLAGSVITIVACAVAVMSILDGFTVPGFFEMLPVIAMLGVIMIAAPGVPGGAIMAAIGVLTSMLGFTEVAFGLMIALYMAQDSFGTAANVTGDGAIALAIDKFTDKVK